MLSLPELLQKYQRRSNLTIAQLAKSLGIHRPTLYQYFQGKRPITNREILKNLITLLRLTPMEANELLQAFEIAQVGPQLYAQRQQVECFLRSLDTVNNDTPTLSLPSAIPYPFTPQNPAQTYCGELTILRVLHWILSDSLPDLASPMRVVLPPQHFLMKNIASVLLLSDFKQQIAHVFCIEHNGEDYIAENFSTLKCILAGCFSLENYQPYYYYGSACEHFGTLSFFPGLIIVNGYVLLVSSDCQNALLLHQHDAVQMYIKLFENLVSQCHSFGQKLALSTDLVIFQNTLPFQFFSEAYELTSGLCSTCFWDAILIDRYLSQEVPRREQFVQQLTQYCKALYAQKKLGHPIVLMSLANAQKFVEQGILQEYPASYLIQPLSIADRKLLLQRILAASEEGWYQVRFVAHQNFPLCNQWEIGVNHSDLLLQYFTANKFCFFHFQESSVISSLYDYLAALEKNDATLSQEESQRLLRQWLEI